MNIYQNICEAKAKGEKLLAILIDPEKTAIATLPALFVKIHQSAATYIFVGGSTDINNVTATVVKAIKKITDLPVLLFPGDFEQLTNHADGLLFLSLISGRNPEYLIGQQVKAIKKIEGSQIEIISTGYILIDGGVETAVQRVSGTKPIAQHDIETITATALAGQYLGNKLIYLEAGSGAAKAVSQEIISGVANSIKIPLIVGGGIRTKIQLQNAYTNGADLVVIGTAFEENNTILTSLL